MTHPGGQSVWRIGIDLGGSKIEGVALDVEGNERWRKRIATPRNDYAASVEAIAGLVHEAERAVERSCAVGIGTPGAVSQSTGRMKNCNSTWLNGQPLKQDLEAALGRKVRLANDANCFALAEARRGAGQGASTLFGVILGTGVGGGIVLHGAVIEGANAIAGEWGHNPMPWPKPEEWPGPGCYCGRSGCIEAFLSGPALSSAYARASGHDLDAAAIVRRAAQRDTVATECLAQYQERLARALAHVINVLDPEVIVLGGGVSNIDSLYQAVPQTWPNYVFSDHIRTRLVKHRLGDSAGVLGAAWLW
jgi:predicted NBD/HSP70 family sugar kinase